MNSSRSLLISAAALVFSGLAAWGQIAPFPLTQSGLVISRPVQPMQPFTVAGERGVLVGTQDGQFESWILPVKLISHLTIEADVEGYPVPIAVNQQAANIEVRPDRTTITYSHIAFTLRQIMLSPDDPAGDAGGGNTPSTGPVALFQIDSQHPLDLVFRFTPEMRWMWPKRNDGIPGPDWVAPGANGPPGGYYTLHMDYPDLAGAIAIPTATPGILAPYQERPQVHPLELHLHYDPKRDGQGANAKLFPLLMAVGTTPESATNKALGAALAKLNDSIPALYKSHAESYAKLQAETTSIETPDKALNEAFQWGVVSIEQLKAHEFVSGQTALVAGYYASGDSARPGFGWFFGRDALYTLYAVNGFGDFALTRAELAFLIARQRADGKIMHEYSQTAGDPSVHWKDFGYMYAAADATPLFLMAIRDYMRASGDLEFVSAHREAIEKAWAFETAASSDTDHDGIYDNSQGTGWVESWPDRSGRQAMPHQEVYLALLDEQASQAYAALEVALGNQAASESAAGRAAAIQGKIEQEYADPQKGCYAFSHNLARDPNGETDRASTVYPAIAWWDWTSPTPPLAHGGECLKQFAGPAMATDWGLRDVADTEPFYDGMSYHQGSVWPLFTGWGALAEYRGGQPFAGEQMLMQNVDLTWAQDPGAVTELLSGDFFVPFGRSTSHQLWSSAMVITPVLRGLFGIGVDAATKTITVNPHLPPGWDDAAVNNLRVGDQTVDLVFTREEGFWSVGLVGAGTRASSIKLRSDVAGAKISAASMKQTPLFEIPLPVVELSPAEHSLPQAGSRPEQAKILSSAYGARSLNVTVAGKPGTDAKLILRRNQNVSPKIAPVNSIDRPGAKVGLEGIIAVDGPETLRDPFKATGVFVHFPDGQGWQTLEFTLTW